MKYEGQQLKINAENRRLELDTGEGIAFIEYKLLNDILFLIHTEVPVSLEGKGAGSAIALKALQYAKNNNYKIVPICPFIQNYLKRHKQWNEIVAPITERFLPKH
jgi:predicted GNAT family acetyltransferase